MKVRSKYTVWKIARNGKYSRLVKEYETLDGARKRASREARDGIRSGVRYVVVRSSAGGGLAEDKRASEVGMDGIEFSGGADFVAEVSG